MNRDQVIRKLRKLARKQGKAFSFDPNKGKGSHYGVRYDGRITILRHEINPLSVSRILKQLNIDEDEFHKI